MIRRTRAFRCVAWLALAAAVLSATAPTASRLLATVLPGTVTLLVEMCTAAGLQWVEMSPVGEVDAAAQQATSAPMTAMDPNCAYCVLGAVLPFVLALLFALLLALVPVACRQVASPYIHPPRNLRGLGSQAPPLLL